MLPDVQLAYATYGQLSARGDNAILVTHGYTASHALLAHGSGVAEGSWAPLIGPRRPLDPERFFIVCPNMLGSCYGSTGPASIDPATGRLYGGQFPDISFGDIVASLFGGPAGTNYGENLSTMAITRNFSTKVLGAAAVMAMALSFLTPISAAIQSVPSSVINGACIYLFGVIGAQGVAIMINKKVDLFDARNLAIIAVILVIGLGGSYGFPGGMIPAFGVQFPAIATAATVGIVLNLLLSIGRKKTAEVKEAA